MDQRQHSPAGRPARRNANTWHGQALRNHSLPAEAVEDGGIGRRADERLPRRRVAVDKAGEWQGEGGWSARAGGEGSQQGDGILPPKILKMTHFVSGTGRVNKPSVFDRRLKIHGNSHGRNGDRV